MPSVRVEIRAECQAQFALVGNLLHVISCVACLLDTHSESMHKCLQSLSFRVAHALACNMAHVAITIGDSSQGRLQVMLHNVMDLLPLGPQSFVILFPENNYEAIENQRMAQQMKNGENSTERNSNKTNVPQNIL